LQKLHNLFLKRIIKPPNPLEQNVSRDCNSRSEVQTFLVMYVPRTVTTVFTTEGQPRRSSPLHKILFF